MDFDQKIQAIFDKIIDARIYPSNSFNISYNYMCTALNTAYALGQGISYEEYRIGMSAISGYIGHFHTLWAFLRMNNLPSDQKDCLAIYRDWKNRPLQGIKNRY